MRTIFVGGALAAVVFAPTTVPADDAALVADAKPQAVEAVDYLTHIKPLLAHRCANCHGTLRQKGGLRLDAAALIRQGGDSGAAIAPGKPDESLLLMYVTPDADGDAYMPEDGPPLKPEEIALLKRWIAAGAPAPRDEEIAENPRDYWAFQKPSRPEIPRSDPDAPSVRVASQADRNPIDAFLAARHAELGLVPQPEAPKHILLRRVHLDLIGLPPTPDEVAAFLADDSPDAYEKVVDRLLESPHHGERWGRHWMDVWRYSDWYGYRNELRNSVKHIWQWRDWIVESLNDDKPYDRMIVEMLAADEAAPADADALRATGFLARHYYKFNRNVWMDDAVEHTSKAFLGLTLNCAKCHDHMYDPLSQRDYYAMRAVFEPYSTRHDQLPGETNVDTLGLPVVYDATLDAKTFVFARGDEKKPDKDNPVAPAIPSLFEKMPFDVQPVELPPEAWYPGLRPHVQANALDVARAEVEKRRRELAAAEKAFDAARAEAANADAAKPQAGGSPPVPPDVAGFVAVDDGGFALAIAAKQLEAAESRLAFAEKRIAADIARHAQPPSEHADELAKVAAAAERAANALQSAAALLQAELAERQAKRNAASKPDDKKLADAAAAATKALDAARKNLETAQAATKKADGQYSPLTPSYPKTSTGRRLALARWIADRDNPLTARVAVNHVWMRHMGTPLVASVFEFGLNGKEPTQPELLDWLAVEFMDSGWSMKKLHRLIVTSHAYRRTSSTHDAAPRNLEIDGDNIHYWRMNSRRMEGEIVRDSVLAVAGTLDRTLGGPDLDQTTGLATHRRSIYYRHAAEKYMTFLQLFDAANV
ncbi:MAG: PSD1 and planctomycete cytochrome C domain-containing protein, partial [Planctomycetaceae bacterium]